MASSFLVAPRLRPHRRALIAGALVACGLLGSLATVAAVRDEPRRAFVNRPPCHRAVHRPQPSVAPADRCLAALDTWATVRRRGADDVDAYVHAREQAITSCLAR